MAENLLTIAIILTATPSSRSKLRVSSHLENSTHLHTILFYILVDLRLVFFFSNLDYLTTEYRYALDFLDSEMTTDMTEKKDLFPISYSYEILSLFDLFCDNI